MMQPFGANRSELALGLFVQEAGGSPVQGHALGDVPARHASGEEDREWENSWIDLGGEG